MCKNKPWSTCNFSPGLNWGSDPKHISQSFRQLTANVGITRYLYVQSVPARDDNTIQYNTIQYNTIQYNIVQYSTENFYSAAIFGVAKFKGASSQIHQTENFSPEESLIRHQEIGKSTDEEG